MNLLTFLLANWRGTGAVILLLLNGLTLTLYRNAEKEIDALKTQYRSESAVREYAALVAKNRSDLTLKEINSEHTKLVAQAEKTAVANFKRRYPDFDRSSLGSGVCSPPVFGLRLPSTSPDSPIADSAKSADGPAEGIMAPNSELLERFATECALDALHLQQFQRWITLNNFPIEP